MIFIAAVEFRKEKIRLKRLSIEYFQQKSHIFWNKKKGEPHYKSEQLKPFESKI